MSIRQQGETFLVDVSVNGQRHRSMFFSRADAEDAERKLRDRIIPGPKGWTLEHAYEQVSSNLWKGTGGERSAVRNAQAALNFFGPTTPLNDLTTDWIDAYIARLKQIGNSGGTINRKLAALSCMLTYAAKRGHLDKKPHLERQRESKGRIRFLTREEEATIIRLMQQWGKDDHAECVQVLVDTGIRPSELWNLETKDYNKETGMLALWHPKNEEPRSVPATGRVKEIIERRLEFTPKGQRLFPFDNFWMEHVWDRVKEQMGLGNDKQFLVYALRHTCASRLVQRGVHLRYVKEWMGHKTLAITMRYAHLSPTGLAEAVKVLEQC